MNPDKLVFIDESSINAGMTRLYGRGQNSDRVFDYCRVNFEMSVIFFTFAAKLKKCFMSKIYYKVTLTEEERSKLIILTKKGKHSSRKVIHGLILLNSDEGEFSERSKSSNKSVSDFLHIGERQKISRARSRPKNRLHIRRLVHGREL